MDWLLDRNQVRDAPYAWAVVACTHSSLEIEEGYIRNIFFNVRWLQEQFKGVGTLREAIDNIWNAFNTEYQNYFA